MQKLRLLGYCTWLLATVLLAFVAGVIVTASIVHSGYDPHEDRAPAARIVVAAMALCAGLSAFGSAAQRVRGRRGLSGFAEVILTTSTLMLVLLWGAVALATGPQ
jgi:peptidoglycan biosynthesis protein MviN/MurJ (putative lipid II flippase)